MSALATTRNPLAKISMYLGAIRVWESLYALPFAYMGMVLAADGWPTWNAFIWITVAMAGARTLAMSANRLIHRKEDAANPRTANRHLPQGLLSPREVIAMMVVSAAVFFFAAYQLNTLTLILAPVAALYVVLYSYAKYYTWACNLFLGWGLAIAPIGAWVAVTGTLEPQAVLLSFAVAMWAGGFDVLYSCGDYDFDREYGVNSIPRRFRNRGGVQYHQVFALPLGGIAAGPGILARAELLLLHRLGLRRCPVGGGERLPKGG